MHQNIIQAFVAKFGNEANFLDVAADAKATYMHEQCDDDDMASMMRDGCQPLDLAEGAHYALLHYMDVLEEEFVDAPSKYILLGDDEIELASDDVVVMINKHNFN